MGRAQRGADRRGSGRPVRRAATLVALGALVLPLTTGCSVEEVLRFGWPVGVTPQAEAMREFWTWSAIAALVVGVITWGAMFWAVIFHRKRKAATTRRRGRPSTTCRSRSSSRSCRRSSWRCCSGSP